MFKEILSILRKEDLLKQATEEADKMLSNTEIMFKTAMDMVMECKRPDTDIYEMDKDIDQMESDIRQKVLKHLIIVNNREDVSAALVLTGVARDIERIGDYAKSIFEVLDICPSEFIIGGEGAKLIKEIENQIIEIFTLTREAYKEGNVDKARIVMDKQLQISKMCDDIFEYLSQRPALSVEYAIIYALLSRYLKRVSSHLKNIAANVVNPFSNLEI